MIALILGHFGGRLVTISSIYLLKYFRKTFKLAAVNAGITQNELAIQALKAWKEKHSEV